MPRIPNKPASRATPAGLWLLAGFAAASLAGCNLDTAYNDPIVPGDPQQNHPIVPAEAPTTLDVYPVGGGLDARSVASIRGFAERYRRFGASRITILAPTGRGERSGRVVEAIRRTLASSGLSGYVRVGVYPARDPLLASPVRLVFEGLKAVVPTACGQWPTDLASGSSLQGWENKPYPNFGCATQAALAAQVDDPRDFDEARTGDPPDVIMRMRAIEDVRKGQDPGTAWKTQITPIGQVGGGG